MGKYTRFEDGRLMRPDFSFPGATARLNCRDIWLMRDEETGMLFLGFKKGRPKHTVSKVL